MGPKMCPIQREAKHTTCQVSQNPARGVFGLFPYLGLLSSDYALTVVDRTKNQNVCSKISLHAEFSRYSAVICKYCSFMAGHLIDWGSILCHTFFHCQRKLRHRTSENEVMQISVLRSEGLKTIALWSAVIQRSVSKDINNTWNEALKVELRETLM